MKTKGKEVVKLVSGGIDSYIMADLYDGKNVYIDYGQKCAKHEIQALKDLNIKYDLITISSSYIDSDIFVNDRNLAFAAIVSMIYKPDIIMLAGLKDDNCVDKNPEAFKKMSRVLTDFSTKKVEVISPFFDKTKGQIISEFNKKENLSKTFSCYDPADNGKACGNCPACLRKVIALETNFIESGITLKDEIIKEYLSKIHTYDPDRKSRFFIWLKQRKKINAIDLDGVLCEELGTFTNRKPIKQNIEKYNLLDGLKIIYTARLEQDREITEKWLSVNRVSYDALIMNKLPYDKIIDDKAVLI